MSQFEFLSKVTIGQYLPTDSVLHRLDPRARIVAAMFLLAAVAFAPHALGVALGVALLLGLLALGRIPLRYALRGLLPPLPFLVILALIQVVFNFTTDAAPIFYRWGSWALSLNDLMAGGMLLLRFCGLILGISLATFCISTSELIHGFDSLLSPLRKLGIPTHDFSMMVQITIRFIPFLAISAERIAKAQASRGAEWGTRSGGLFARVRQVMPLIVPLFLTSLRKAENLALAMDARGYGNVSYTSMTVFRFQWRDGAALLLAAVSAALMILI